MVRGFRQEQVLTGSHAAPSSLDSPWWKTSLLPRRSVARRTWQLDTALAAGSSIEESVMMLPLHIRKGRVAGLNLCPSSQDVPLDHLDLCVLALSESIFSEFIPCAAPQQPATSSQERRKRNALCLGFALESGEACLHGLCLSPLPRKVSINVMCVISFFVPFV